MDGMRKSDALKVFGSNRAIAQALDISDAAVSQWGEFVPPISAKELARHSKGKLPFKPEVYRDCTPRIQHLAEMLSATS